LNAASHLLLLVALLFLTRRDFSHSLQVCRYVFQTSATSDKGNVHANPVETVKRLNYWENRRDWCRLCRDCRVKLRCWRRHIRHFPPCLLMLILFRWKC